MGRRTTRKRKSTRVSYRRYMEMVCAVCGEFFYTYMPQSLYCSDACNMRAYRKRQREQREGA